MGEWGVCDGLRGRMGCVNIWKKGGRAVGSSRVGDAFREGRVAYFRKGSGCVQAAIDQRNILTASAFLKKHNYCLGEQIIQLLFACLLQAQCGGLKEGRTNLLPNSLGNS